MQLVSAATIEDGRPTTVLAIGKAAPRMLAGARIALGARLKRSVCAGPSSGSHPLPDSASVAAGEALLAAARAALDGERVLALISGGGSSLAVALPQGIELEQKRETNRLLIASGAPIDEINLVRKHISALKGGRLAAAIGGGELSTLVISDVVSGDLAAVASGPTIADASTAADALAIAERYHLPRTIIDYLRGQGDRGLPPPRGACDRPRLLADNLMLVRTAAKVAQERGIATAIVEEPLLGSPAVVAGTIARLTERAADETLIVCGGESTPRVPRAAGRGGRAHHLALLLAPLLAARSRGAVLAVGSDGVDGGSGGAGALVDCRSAQALADCGIDVGDAISRFDSAPALERIGASVAARQTGSNLADLVLVWTGRAGAIRPA